MTRMSEEIRLLRTRLPLPEGMTEGLGDMLAQAHQSFPGPGPQPSEASVRAMVPALALSVRHLGCPWPVLSAQDQERANRAMSRMATESDTLGTMARAALAFGAQYVVHVLHKTASRTMLETDLNFWPTSTPRALTRPLLLEADPKCGDGCLFGPVQSILYVPDADDGWAQIVVGAEGWTAKTRVPFSWSSEDDAESVQPVLEVDMSACVRQGPGGMEVNAVAVLRYLVTFAMFLQAESQATGRNVADIRATSGTLPDGRKPKVGQGYTVRYIRISDEALATPSRKPGEAQREAPPHPEGLVAEPVLVRGFLRRQPCGPGNRDRKVIFVAPFQRQQWVSPERVVRVR